MNLYEITFELKELEIVLSDQEGDASDELLAQYFDRLDDRDTKLDNYAALIKNLEAQSLVRKNEAKRLAELAKQDDNAIKRLKECLKDAFQSNPNWGVVLTKRFKLSLQRNGGKAPLVMKIDDPNLLPDAFRKAKYEADNEAIRKALEEGEELGFAELGAIDSTIRIK